MRAVTCQCDIPKAHDGRHHGVDRHGHEHHWDATKAT